MVIVTRSVFATMPEMAVHHVCDDCHLNWTIGGRLMRPSCDQLKVLVNLVCGRRLCNLPVYWVFVCFFFGLCGEKGHFDLIFICQGWSLEKRTIQKICLNLILIWFCIYRCAVMVCIGCSWSECCESFSFANIQETQREAY